MKSLCLATKIGYKSKQYWLRHSSCILPYGWWGIQGSLSRKVNIINIFSNSNIFKEEVLFPRNPCRPGGNIEFLENGNMELLDIGVTLTYMQFCVDQNLPVSKKRINLHLVTISCRLPQTWMVTSLSEPAFLLNQKMKSLGIHGSLSHFPFLKTCLRFYYIIMSLSIVSLIITIMVYSFFHKALLR